MKTKTKKTEIHFDAAALVSRVEAFAAGRAPARERDWMVAERGGLATLPAMSEITFTVSPCEETGVLVAAWDAPGGGGITTQGASVEELRANIREAMACHFDEGETPACVRLHFAGDVLLQSA